MSSRRPRQPPIGVDADRGGAPRSVSSLGGCTAVSRWNPSRVCNAPATLGGHTALPADAASSLGGCTPSCASRASRKRPAEDEPADSVQGGGDERPAALRQRRFRENVLVAAGGVPTFRCEHCSLVFVHASRNHVASVRSHHCQRYHGGRGCPGPLRSLPFVGSLGEKLLKSSTFGSVLCVPSACPLLVRRLSASMLRPSRLPPIDVSVIMMFLTLLIAMLAWHRRQSYVRRRAARVANRLVVQALGPRRAAPDDARPCFGRSSTTRTVASVSCFGLLSAVMLAGTRLPKARGLFRHLPIGGAASSSSGFRSSGGLPSFARGPVLSSPTLASSIKSASAFPLTRSRLYSRLPARPCCGANRCSHDGHLCNHERRSGPRY